MSLFASVNGVRIVSGAIIVPYFGTWAADLMLATPDAVTDAPLGCTVTMGQLTLRGSTYRTAPFAGSRALRLVGGAGGWRKTLQQRAYYQGSGLPLSMILNDAARENGESVHLDQDRIVGSYMTRESAPGSRTLRELVDLWWVDAAGVTQVAQRRPSAAISSDFQVISYDGGRGSFQVATESHQDWMPGNTFTSVTVRGVQTISLSTFHVEANGQLRVEVLASGAVDS